MALKKDELANPNGCLNQAADDEPIFVLRANDELAANVVRIWAARYWLNNASRSEDGRLISDRQQAKHEEALRLANQMEEWRKAKELKS